MPPTLLQIILLGLVQGAAELLPVSSSAHVIVAEKLMKLDPASPEMTFLLVMLHTGTMFAVIAYFWRSWRETFFSSTTQFVDAVKKIAVATVCTLVVGGLLELVIEKVVLGGGEKAEMEQLFSSLPLIAGALFTAGALIIWSAFKTIKETKGEEVALRSSVWIGLVQGICIPFRGLSRSGSTISVGMLAGVGRRQAEVFSFALAVVLTPLAIAKELLRLLKSRHDPAAPLHLGHLLQPGLIGMLCSFVAGLVALVWLSRWLESGRWRYFGYYCIVSAGVIFALGASGF
jgi:undecaprenyl-diphosphatase